MLGTIVWFNPEKGIGEIRSKAGAQFFFSYHDFPRGKEVARSLENADVKFNCGPKSLFGKPRALEITLLRQKNQTDQIQPNPEREIHE